MINWRDVSVRAHKHAKKAGFWTIGVSVHDLISQINGEVSEFEKAYRNDHVADISEYKNRISLLDGNKLRGTLKEHAFRLLMKDSTGDELSDIGISLASFAVGIGIPLQRDKFKKHDSILNIALEQNDVYMMINRLHALISEIGMPFIVKTAFACQFHHDNISICIHAVELISKHLEIDLPYHLEEKMGFNLSRPHLHGKVVKYED